MSAAEALIAEALRDVAAAVRGIGVDVVDVQRLRAMLERRGQPLYDRLFTPAEQALCEGGSPRHRAYRLAGRIAAKEAVRKTLGEHGPGCGWRDIEIGRAVSGQPVPRVSGRAEEAFRRASFTGLHLSITHEAGLAVAIALAV
ncbi:holo-ACP synthase [Streptomyces sp. NBC_01373]|uniref:holo-ACP synthase n=1 Tax=Streptomyces sp. NBC_01373 TaxID=2903843 RepID=UPI002259057D|nr:holo-ACP synthase [Streptomyces sp. NBC_01373]MCX4700860.1 holo-ACP synthase [Streptomyces sp. NBC_01373]